MAVTESGAGGESAGRRGRASSGSAGTGLTAQAMMHKETDPDYTLFARCSGRALANLLFGPSQDVVCFPLNLASVGCQPLPQHQTRKDPGILGIAFHEPFGFTQHPMKPFQPGPLHPARGSSPFIRQEVDRGANAQSHFGRDLFAMSMDPALLFRRPQPDHEDIRLAVSYPPQNLFDLFRLFFESDWRTVTAHDSNCIGTKSDPGTRSGSLCFRSREAQTKGCPSAKTKSASR